MKNFINLKDIPAKDLRKILNDTKKRKNKRKKLNTLDVDKDKPLKCKLIILKYEKQSSRTRLSFYLSIALLGAGSIKFGSAGTNTSTRNTIEFGAGFNAANWTGNLVFSQNYCAAISNVTGNNTTLLPQNSKIETLDNITGSLPVVKFLDKLFYPIIIHFLSTAP